MRTAIRITVLAVVALLAVPLMLAPASAHNASVYYRPLWPSGSNVEYGFETGYPQGAFRFRVTDGDHQWSRRGGSAGEPDFFANLPDRGYGEPNSPCRRNQGTGAIYMRDLDAFGLGVLGATWVCYGDGLIATFTMAFDSDREWYNGTGDAPDGVLGIGALPDLWSVASHEFGHATGFIFGPNNDGHFDEDWAVCGDGSGRHTMCPRIDSGTEMMRTLNTHDAHTFTSAYTG